MKRMQFSHERLHQIIDGRWDIQKLVELLDVVTPDDMHPSQAMIYQWMNGERKPSADYLPYLRLVLGCKRIDDFYTEAEVN